MVKIISFKKIGAISCIFIVATLGLVIWDPLNLIYKSDRVFLTLPYLPVSSCESKYLEEITPIEWSIQNESNWLKRRKLIQDLQKIEKARDDECR